MARKACCILSSHIYQARKFFSSIHHSTSIVDTTVRNLAEEVKSLGSECDLLYAEFERIVSKSETGSPPLNNVDGRIWNCTATQVEEPSRTIQELEFFVRSVRRDKPNSMVPSDIVFNAPSVFSGDEAHTVVTSATSAQRAMQEREATDAAWDESDDDLDTDLAKAALDTGTKAFKAQEWEEAESHLQEALRVLQHLQDSNEHFATISVCSTNLLSVHITRNSLRMLKKLL
ncbi:MAG: hypothetical protein M1835_006823 [Candelina submexicana]|nr:MAG: hypothetical protein M1835_006823 [Candelina submexicana]